MKKLNKTKIDAILETISDICIFLNETCKLHDLKVYPDRTTDITYFTENYYITIKTDANNYPYSVKVHLTKQATVSGVQAEKEVIASPVPFDKIPF